MLKLGRPVEQCQFQWVTGPLPVWVSALGAPADNLLHLFETLCWVGKVLNVQCVATVLQQALLLCCH